MKIQFCLGISVSINFENQKSKSNNWMNDKKCPNFLFIVIFTAYISWCDTLCKCRVVSVLNSLQVENASDICDVGCPGELRRISSV